MAFDLGFEEWSKFKGMWLESQDWEGGFPGEIS